MVHYIHLERPKESVSSGDEDITGESREQAERYFYEPLVKLTRTKVAVSREREKPAFHRCSVAHLHFFIAPFGNVQRSSSSSPNVEVDGRRHCCSTLNHDFRPSIYTCLSDSTCLRSLEYLSFIHRLFDDSISSMI